VPRGSRPSPAVPAPMALAAAAVLLAGCGGATGGGGTGGGSTGGQAGAASSAPTEAAGARGGSAAATATPGGSPAATATPDDVALDAVRAWLSYDTRVDAGPDATTRRLALQFLAPDLRRAAEGRQPQAAPGADWDGWARRHATAAVTVRIDGDDHPPDGADEALRQVAADVVLRGDDGFTAEQHLTQFLRLVLTAEGWRVAEVTGASAS